MRELASFLRAVVERHLAAIICLCILVAATVWITHQALYTALDRVVQVDTEAHVVEWASLVGPEALGGETSARIDGANAELENIVQYGLGRRERVGFSIFDASGRTVQSSDHSWEQQVKTELPDHVRRVYETGAASTHIHHLGEHAIRPLVVVESLAPIFGEDGSVAGVLNVRLDKTAAYREMFKRLEFLAYFVPLLCAAAFAGPGIAYLLMREKSERRDEQVQHLSRFDSLTGVLNRSSFMEECAAFFEARGSQWRESGVFFIDVDEFKKINDELGHEFGDHFLTHVAAAIRGSVRAEDLVGRIGGDEFVVLAPQIYQGSMMIMAERILKAASAPFSHNGRTISGKICVGAHLSPPGEPLEPALHSADMALYEAKRMGRNRVIQYKKEFSSAMRRRNAVESRMKAALEEGLFDVAYQPIVNASTYDIAGFEALLRLKSEDGSPISPEEFIPIAEENGMIHEIGQFVLNKALDVARSWPDHVFLSINLSPVQFEQGDVVRDVARALAERDFAARRLELEVTENLMLRDSDDVACRLEGLRSLGVSIAVDDFGVGYSSLGYLWKFRFAKIKVDRTFLQGYELDKTRHRDILEAVVLLGHKLGMRVTVEGVEHVEHARILSNMGCDQLQGFVFSRPMPGPETLAALGGGPGAVLREQMSVGAGS